MSFLFSLVFFHGVLGETFPDPLSSSCLHVSQVHLDPLSCLALAFLFYALSFSLTPLDSPHGFLFRIGRFHFGSSSPPAVLSLTPFLPGSFPQPPFKVSCSFLRSRVLRLVLSRCKFPLSRFFLTPSTDRRFTPGSFRWEGSILDRLHLLLDVPLYEGTPRQHHQLLFSKVLGYPFFVLYPPKEFPS